jgi:hypothetical protein
MQYIPQPSAFFRASAMREAGPWRADVSYAADAEFFLRIAMHHRTRKINAVLARYRYHDAQRDKESTRVPRDWAKAVEPLTHDRDPRVRRMARGGIWLVRRYYTPERRWARRVWYAYRMAIANPALFRHMDRRDLIPGREPLRRLLSRGKRKIGAVAYDWPRFLRSMTGRWTTMRNRNEAIRIDPATGGAHCDWTFTSDLHIASVYPFTARWLLQRASRDWPFAYAERPAIDGDPRVSFIIGHRGEARIPLLEKTIASIAAQRGVAIECIVVEQDEHPRLRLPDWVRHIPMPVAAGTPYNRSAAFNAGAYAARAPLLVLHDNDILVPVGYAARFAQHHDDGLEFIDLKRFLFYLSETETAHVLASERFPAALTPERVMQNARGGSIAADRDAFLDIGGFDEAFVGWGGEDNELWGRAETRRAWRYGYLPLVHLWHAPQPEKESAAPGIARLRELEHVPPVERIARLRQNRSK